MRQDYDAFGNPHDALLPGLTGPRFTGKDWDEDTELYYFNARWYDPDLGRFITEDPIRDGVNWYGYVNNRPLNLVDPMGLFPRDDDGFVIDGTKGGTENEIITNSSGSKNMKPYPSKGSWEYEDYKERGKRDKVIFIGIVGLVDPTPISDLKDIKDYWESGEKGWAITTAALAAFGAAGDLANKGLKTANKALKCLKEAEEIFSLAAKAGKRSGEVFRAANKLGKVNEFVEGIKSGIRYFGTHREMRKITDGFGSLIESHHLIPKAEYVFKGLQRLGYSGTVDDMAAVVLDKATHSNITRMWNKAIKDLKGLGGDVTVDWMTLLSG